jgi:O-antigen/teichoic acid export membrane protein
MLAKHSLFYFISHGLPALISFASIAIFTRLLTPEEYGIYALIFAIAGLINAVVFEWLKFSLIRYYPKHRENPTFLETIKVSFLGLVLTSTVVGLFFYLLFEQLTFLYVAICLVLSWSQSWYGIHLSLLRAQLNPKSYGYLSFSRVALGLVLSTSLIVIGLNEVGLLIGMIAAFWLTLLVPTFKVWKVRTKLTQLDRNMFKGFVKYGFPLTITFLLTVVIHNSDRLIIEYLLTTSDTGVYSVTYDLTQQTIYTFMMVINLAAFPIAIKALEEQGEEAAYQQVRKNTSLIFLIAMPAALGVIILSSNFVHLFLGEEFRQQAMMLIPYIAIAAVLRGFKIYCVDIVFHLKQESSMQMIPVVGAAVLNIGLNFLLIPLLGIEGAAIATVAAYAVAIIMSWIIVHVKINPLPFPTSDFFKIILATLIMGLVIWPLRNHVGIASFIYQVMIGVIIYGISIIIVNALGVRGIIKAVYHNKIKSRFQA